ncbi:MAG: SIMPL domain-containing protein [Ignavibacteria bacterium]|nr:SIMPL domain-containing protein [Ignavibacteria bacterium]
MNNNNTVNNIRDYIPAAAILAGAFIIGAFILSSTWKYVSRKDVTINVTGSASKDIKSDYAIWNGSVSIESLTLQESYTKLKTANERVKNYLVSKGFPEEKITVSAINTFTIYANNEQGYSTNRITGYRLNQDFRVESEDVERIDKLSREATELINEGIEINSPTPEFLYTKISDLKVEMTGLAAQDAKERAEQIANSTGNKIGEVRSSKMGVIQINAKNSNEISDYGINNTSSIDKTIRVVVNMSFSID